jgi:hypothetical protein
VKWTDGSRIETYQLCPRRYQFKYELRLIPREVSPSAPMTFGLGLHAALEAIYMGHGPEYVPCDHNAPPTGEGLCVYCKPNKGQIRRMFNDFLRAFPPSHEQKVYTQHLGLLLITRYLEKWQKDPLADGVFAVEATFSADLGGIPYIGRVDLLTRWDSINYVLDHKSKGRFNDTYIRTLKLDGKMTGYLWAVSDLLGEPITSGIINGILVAPNITPNSFVRFITQRTPAEIDQWQQNALALLDDMTRDKNRDFYPMDTASCFAYGRECEYYRICASPKNRHVTISQFYSEKPEQLVPFGLEEPTDD